MRVNDSPTLQADWGEQRPVPRSRRSGFGAVLRAVAGAAASIIPGVGPVLGAIAGKAGGLNAALLDGDSEALRYLELQRAISRETREIETISNVMKARHDAAMNTIRNLRS